MLQTETKRKSQRWYFSFNYPEKSNLENSLEQIKDNSPCRITINPAEIKIDFTSLKM